jgi:glucosyl-3-phosphoglycerate synthase
MSDFFQHSQFTTLHRLSLRPIEELEEVLERCAERRRMALLLPSLASEMDGPALGGIVDQLRKVPYLHRIVIALDRADRADYDRALDFFSVLPQPTSIVWLDGPRAKKVFQRFESEGLVRRERGKGQAVWFALGHLVAQGDCDCVALHDCDIVTYDRSLVARLCFPVLNPDVDFKFAKAYYARLSDKLNGRVCRLFVYPLLTTLRSFYPNQEFLEYMSSFRYPLAGEMAMDLDVARHIRIPFDWGLEVGLLAEVWHNLSLKQICQVDVSDRYDHKHQDLSAEDPEKGLMRMVRDITTTLLRTLAAQGTEISAGVLRSLEAAYVRNAQDYVERYAIDAAINGYPFDRHQEEQAVESFGRAIVSSGEQYLENVLYSPLMPNWNRVAAALPDVMGDLADLPRRDRDG